MKKFLLFSAIALVASLMPAKANTAFTKTQSGFNMENATENRFRVAYNATGHELPMTTDDSYTIGFWVNRTALFDKNGVSGLVGKSVIAGFVSERLENDWNAWALTVDNDSIVNIDGWGGTGSHNIDGFKMELNKWYYMMVAIDNTTKECRVYLDDKKVISTPISGGGMAFTPNPAEGTPIFRFGGFGFTGQFDNISFFNRALDDDEALIAYYAPQKLTPECTALFDFEDQTNIAKNSAVDGAEIDAYWEQIEGGLLAQNGVTGLQGKTLDNGEYYKFTTLTPTENNFVESYEMPAIPSLSITIPELQSYDHATLTLTKEDGTELHAGDVLEYELGDKIFTSATSEEDYAIIKITRLTRVLNNNDHFYPVYDIREWRPINIELRYDKVTMTVENYQDFNYTIVYADDDSEVNPDAVLYGRTLKLTLGDNAGKTLDAIKVDGVELTPNADGTYTFVRPAMDFTLTIEGHVNEMFNIIIARTEGGTITVTDDEGNTVASNSPIAEGITLTVTATPDEGNSMQLRLNGTDINSGATHEVHSDVVVAVVFGEPGTQVEEPEYCVPSADATATDKSTTTTNTGRGVTNVKLTDGTNTTNVAGTGTSNGRNIYSDKTATVFNTEAGKNVTFTATGSGEWMNTAIYIDFDRNGFDANDRLYNTYDLSGNHYSAIACSGQFAIPADIATGDYRARYVLDWQSVDPCYYRYGQNGSNTNNGEMYLDFTIHVDGTPAMVAPDNDLIDQEVKLLTLMADGNGHVEAWSSIDENGNPAGIRYENGEGLFLTQPLYFFFVPDEFYMLQGGSIDNGGNLQQPEEDTYTEIEVAGDVTASGSFIVNLAAIDSVGIDANAPVELYNIQGMRINNTNTLTPGIYIMRQGGKSVKVLINRK